MPYTVNQISKYIRFQCKGTRKNMGELVYNFGDKKTF